MSPKDNNEFQKALKKITMFVVGGIFLFAITTAIMSRLHTDNVIESFREATLRIDTVQTLQIKSNTNDINGLEEKQKLHVTKEDLDKTENNIKELIQAFHN